MARSNKKGDSGRPKPWFSDPGIVSVTKPRNDGGLDIYGKDTGDPKGYSHYRQDRSGDVKVLHSGQKDNSWITGKKK